MATLEQKPGALDLAFIAGDDFSFTATMEGDSTSSTHSAAVYDGSREVVAFTVSPVFVSPNTVVSFSLTDSQTLAANPSALSWAYRQTSGGITRTILAGSVSVAKQ